MLHRLLSHGLQPQRHPSGTCLKVVFHSLFRTSSEPELFSRFYVPFQTKKIPSFITTDLKLQLFLDENRNNKEDSVQDF